MVVGLCTRMYARGLHERALWLTCVRRIRIGKAHKFSLSTLQIKPMSRKSEPNQGHDHATHLRKCSFFFYLK